MMTVNPNMLLFKNNNEKSSFCDKYKSESSTLKNFPTDYSPGAFFWKYLRKVKQLIFFVWEAIQIIRDTQGGFFRDSITK